MKLPLVPLMVTTRELTGAPLGMVIFMEEFPPPVVAVTGFGVNVTAVVGSPVSLTVTELEVVNAVAVTVKVPDEPRGMLIEATDVERLKSVLLVVPQEVNLNEAMRVFQLNEPLVDRYWFVCQKVQSSLGSI